MQRALWLLLGIAAIVWFEFQIFPGHTYLHGDTQIFLPILERLDAPGYLSRDLVATHPHVTYTIYDELTLFLHEAAGFDFKTVLLSQQILCRASGILGVFLVATAIGVADSWALLVAAVVNLGAALPGPRVSITGREATPHALAFDLVSLAIGLLARERPLLAALVGGLALLYHVPIAAPFWIVLLIAFAFDRKLRTLLRPALSILLVFALLLANLSQLQPGVVEPQPLFARISTQLANLQQFRTPSVWVSSWAGHEIWLYLAIWTCCVWATARIWPSLNRQTRWFAVLLPLSGILSVPVSYLLLEQLRWSLIPQLQPARTLVYTAVLASTLCGVAGIKALRRHRALQAVLWLLFVLALPLTELHRTEATLGAPPGSIAQMAGWAETNTWGSSVFLFPDAGRDLYPGVFRAESRRALWVDWESGEQMKYFESAGIEWFERWHDTMQPAWSPQRLAQMLPLPVDYYVLRRERKLQTVAPVFQNREFVVYDAADLRNAETIR